MTGEFTARAALTSGTTGKTGGRFETTLARYYGRAAGVRRPGRGRGLWGEQPDLPLPPSFSYEVAGLQLAAWPLATGTEFRDSLERRAPRG